VHSDTPTTWQVSGASGPYAGGDYPGANTRVTDGTYSELSTGQPVTPGTYSIQAYNLPGYSAPFFNASTQTLGDGSVIDFEIRYLAKPVLDNPSVSCGTVNLNWSSSGSGASYTVFRATSAAGPYSTLASNLSATTYADRPTPTDTTYYYKIRAFKDP